jgi:hypothetical protein
VWDLWFLVWGVLLGVAAWGSGGGWSGARR